MTQLTNVEDVYPLTGTQLGMLYHAINQPDSGVYTNQTMMELSGRLDPPSLKYAWDKVVERHAALRTAFVWSALDDPVQVVRERVDTPWEELDLSELSEDERDTAIESVLSEDRMRGFDLAAAPLTRMTLIRTGPASWLWVWTSHHLSYDGWSTQIILDELFMLYRSRVEGERAELEEPFRFRDFVEFEGGATSAATERFWQERLSGFTEPHHLEVPGLAPESGSVGHQFISIPLSNIEALKTTSAQIGVTLNTLMTGAWSLVLSRWVRSSDVVFGTTVAGRPMHLDGVDRAVGLFITTLPVRVHIEHDHSVAEWLRGIQSDLLAGQENQHVSLADIQRISDIVPGQALFESVLVFGNYPSQERSGGDELSIGTTSYVEASNYPLAVLVEMGSEPELILVYESDRFSADAVESLGRQLEQVLATIVTDSQSSLGSVRLVRDERAPVGEPLETEATTILGVLAAAARPDQPAVVCEDRVITYAELEERSDRMAWQLMEAGTRRGDVIGLYLPRSIEMIVGILGVLKAGGAYVPLDPTYPAEHIQALLEGDDIGFVAGHSDWLSAVPETVVGIDIDDLDTISSQEFPEVGPDDLAYVIHTSGSTGRPKGVMVTHGNLVASTLARHAYYGEPVGSFLLLSPFAFDSSVAGIFWTLTTGGTLVLPAPGEEHDADAVVALIAKHSITHTLCLASVYDVLLDASGGEQLSSLQAVIVAGEACPPGLAASHFEQLGHTALYNEYGPTEATVWCTVHRATPSDDVLPIGRPIAETRILLLDESLNLVPTGFAGEIFIAGAGVTPGYLGRPDLTAERFVSVRVGNAEERVYRTGDLGAWRRDGVLTYLGRSDSQLKIRGRRIEASAVEAALRAHPDIEEAVAVGWSSTGGSMTQLVTYIRSASGDIDVNALKRSLEIKLPAFMVPDIVIPLAAMPRLPNGKVDTHSLPDPQGHIGHTDIHVPPRNDHERLLASIWCELLGVDSVGVRDDFFELGGDSIVSIRMMSRARQAGIYIRPGQIGASRTIEQLAASTNDEPTSSNEAVRGSVPLGPIQQWFFEMDHPAHDQWNQSNLFALGDDVDLTALEGALRACIDQHDMFRARYTQNDDGWEQRIEPGHEFALAVADERADLDEVIRTCHQSLDIEAGPLLGAVLIQRPAGEEDLLFIAVHHLVVDVASWAILVDDIEQAYGQALAGESIDLPARSTSYHDWVRYLSSDAFMGEREFWTRSTTGLANDGLEYWGSAASQQTIMVELESDVTAALFGEANEAYRTRPEELMIAALAAAVPLQPGRSMRLALERHGRPDDVPGIDLSRTIGWFTAQFPVTLTASNSVDAKLLTQTKETVRAVPNGGLGYGTLRYLHRIPELAGNGEPEYLFNYLGRSSADGRGMLRWIAARDEEALHPDSHRAHRFEVVASVREGKLTVRWNFSTLHDDHSAAESLASAHLDRLREIVSHCVEDGTGALTPSDFPAAGLGQGELDDLLDGLV